MITSIYRELLITRPANTTAYTAGDVVGPSTATGGGVLTFSSTGGDNLLFKILSTEYRSDLAAVPASMTSFRLHLYSATPPSAYADNAVWDLPAGDRAAYMGYLDLGTPVDLGSTLYVKTNGINQGLALPQGGTFFGYLVTAGGYTPTSAETSFIRIYAEGI